MRIRDASAADWPGIWAVLEPVIRAGDTYTVDADTPEEALRDWWLHGADPDDGGTRRRAPRTFVVTEETGGEAPPMVVATAELHANYGGAAGRTANAGFMVHPDHVGKGYARALAHHVLDQAAAAGFTDMVFNAVVESNTAAVALWESLGFRIVGTVPAVFDHPVDGLVGLHVMHRSLAGRV
ncbi:GNAT family N-acetyltransferase [Specibacter cremeus]|uniref:GNAT family N-acetyltransferase n=1 Tax=Specibacter cremeus TaxID=1629051 RepID=UPI000F76F2B2|nr:GNAT family N-acetyltransferase [Specibacter cremeus]